MSYIVVDTEKSGGYLTAGKEHATLAEAQEVRTKWVTEMATDYGTSVEAQDRSAEGLFIFQVLAQNEVRVLPEPMNEPDYGYSSLFMERVPGGCLIGEIGLFSEETIMKLNPIVEVANRIDGSIKFSSEG